jgi:hypothetical protein
VGPLLNEPLGKEVGKKYLSQANNVARKLGGAKEDPPSLKPILARRRTPEPHGKAITNAERCKDARTGIRYKRGIVVP